MKKLLFLASVVVLGLSSCEVDDPEIENEEEVITTLRYTLTDGSGNTAVFEFKDLDGDGGNAPTISNANLMANTSYTGSLELLNELESPAESITEEIEEEDDEHQFFFTTTGNLTFAYADADGDGNPIGLATTVATAGAGAQSFTVTLRHEPNKTAMGVRDGNISNAGGETDIEVTFVANVQ